MCTSIRICGEGAYFGRNMDIENDFGGEVVLAPRSYRIKYSHGGEESEHYAILGVAVKIGGYPLYADCMNEAGLCIAGLALAESTYYFPSDGKYDGKRRLASFEVPLFLLSKCKNVRECVDVMRDTVIVDTSFSSDIQATPLHWHIADGCSSAVIEQTREGMKVYYNEVDILTNEPTFECQLRGLSAYGNLTPGRAENCLTRIGGVGSSGWGEGSVGLPGDLSSRSRFIKAAYLTALSGEIEKEWLNEGHLLSLLSAVAVPMGAVVNERKMHYTTYTSLMDIGEASYTYIGRDRLSPKKYYMRELRLDGEELIVAR